MIDDEMRWSVGSAGGVAAFASVPRSADVQESILFLESYLKGSTLPTRRTVTSSSNGAAALTMVANGGRNGWKSNASYSPDPSRSVSTSQLTPSRQLQSPSAASTPWRTAQEYGSSKKDTGAPTGAKVVNSNARASRQSAPALAVGDDLGRVRYLESPMRDTDRMYPPGNSVRGLNWGSSSTTMETRDGTLRNWRSPLPVGKITAQQRRSSSGSSRISGKDDVVLSSPSASPPRDSRRASSRSPSQLREDKVAAVNTTVRASPGSWRTQLRNLKYGDRLNEDEQGRVELRPGVPSFQPPQRPGMQRSNRLREVNTKVLALSDGTTDVDVAAEWGRSRLRSTSRELESDFSTLGIHRESHGIPRQHYQQPASDVERGEGGGGGGSGTERKGLRRSETSSSVSTSSRSTSRALQPRDSSGRGSLPLSHRSQPQLSGSSISHTLRPPPPSSVQSSPAGRSAARVEGRRRSAGGTTTSGKRRKVVTIREEYFEDGSEDEGDETDTTDGEMAEGHNKGHTGFTNRSAGLNDSTTQVIKERRASASGFPHLHTAQPGRHECDTPARRSEVTRTLALSPIGSEGPRGTLMSTPGTACTSLLSGGGLPQDSYALLAAAASAAGSSAPLFLTNHRDNLRRMVSYLKNHYAREEDEEKRGIETMTQDDVLSLAQCFYVDVYRTVRLLRDDTGLPRAGFTDDDPILDDLAPPPPKPPPPQESLVHQRSMAQPQLRLTSRREVPPGPTERAPMVSVSPYRASTAPSSRGPSMSTTPRTLTPAPSLARASPSPPSVVTAPLGKSTPRVVVVQDAPASSAPVSSRISPVPASPPLPVPQPVDWSLDPRPLKTLMPLLRNGGTLCKHNGDSGPNLRFFCVRDCAAIYAGQEALMPHLTWSSHSGPLVSISRPTLPASLPPLSEVSGKHNLIALESVTVGPGGEKAFKRKKGLVVDHEGQVVLPEMCAVLHFGPQGKILVSFLSIEDRAIWLAALVGVVRKNKQLLLSA